MLWAILIEVHGGLVKFSAFSGSAHIQIFILINLRNIHGVLFLRIHEIFTRNIILVLIF
jgi:hypothetical protein